MVMVPRNRLHKLLSDSFTASEMNRFLACPVYEDVARASLPFETARTVDYVFSVVEALERYNLVDDAFWKALREARPGRVAEIDDLAAAWEQEEPGEAAGGDVDRVRRLVDLFEELRPLLPQGNESERVLDRLFQEMVYLLDREATPPLGRGVWADRLGERLATYAWLHNQVPEDYLLELVSGLCLNESDPFGQYWGLRVVSRIQQAHPGFLFVEPIQAALRAFRECSDSADRRRMTEEILSRTLLALPAS